MDANLTIRDLQAEDYDHGFIELIGQLTKAGNIPKEKFVERLNFLNAKNDYIIKVIVDNTGKVVGTGSLVIEYKFIHECASKGHIEDIVIDESMRGKHLGKFLIEELVTISKERGCYKVALCCKDDLVGFYEKCGLIMAEREMILYHYK